MRKRTRGREIALQILYAGEITKDPLEVCLERRRKEDPAEDPEVMEFAAHLVEGVISNLKDIDDMVSASADNWKIERMATIDRNILRIAAFELKLSGDVPPKVAINEAIEMAKKYGDKDSGKFVNGILDKINKTPEVK
ncbi:MAG: transcription antitermination factor NusB [Candidatus Omnitrophica bacterium]|nr:transcription antitermination factor NusB [Candidatus Omnitrophota bacterium]